MDTKNTSNLLKSSKYSMREKKYIFIGIFTEMILDRIIFPKNKDLHEYISLFEKITGKEPYKDYLYKSRITLSARLVKDLFFDDNLDEKLVLKKSISEHIEFVEKLPKKSISDTGSKSSETNLLQDVLKSKTERKNEN